MFETVVPETFERRSKLTFYESLPVSLAAHGIVIAVAVVIAVWNVSFPSQSPRVVRAYTLASFDPPPPPPPPAPPKAVPQVQQAPVVPVKMPEVAPTVIPDIVPPVINDPPKVEAPSTGVAGGIEGGVEGGVVGGSPTGVKGGELGGQTGGVIGGLPKDAPVVIERDKPLPMFPVSQVYPKYPDDARLHNWEDSLVIRYVIGKDGRVREVIVLTPPGRKVFSDVAVKAIRNWRFKPMVRDGETREVIHELTVYFKLEHGG